MSSAGGPQGGRDARFHLKSLAAQRQRCDLQMRLHAIVTGIVASTIRACRVRTAMCVFVVVHGMRNSRRVARTAAA
jgi:hypothetical protein